MQRSTNERNSCRLLGAPEDELFRRDPGEVSLVEKMSDCSNNWAKILIQLEGPGESSSNEEADAHQVSRAIK